MDGPTTDDVRKWLKAIDGQTITPAMFQDLKLSLESALDFIDELAKGPTGHHPLYPDK